MGQHRYVHSMMVKVHEIEIPKNYALFGTKNGTWVARKAELAYYTV